MDHDAAITSWVKHMGGGDNIVVGLRSRLKANLTDAEMYSFRGDALYEIISVMIIDNEEFLDDALVLAVGKKNLTTVRTDDLLSVSLLRPLTARGPHGSLLSRASFTSLRADFDIGFVVDQHLLESAVVLDDVTSHVSRAIIWDRMMRCLDVLVNEVFVVEENACTYRFDPEPESKEQEDENVRPHEHNNLMMDKRHEDFMDRARAVGLDARLLTPPAPSVEGRDQDQFRITFVPGMVRMAAERLGMRVSAYSCSRMGHGGWITTMGQEKREEVRAAQKLYTMGYFARQMHEYGGSCSDYNSDTSGNDDDSYNPFSSEDSDSEE